MENNKPYMRFPRWVANDPADPVGISAGFRAPCRQPASATRGIRPPTAARIRPAHLPAGRATP